MAKIELSITTTYCPTWKTWEGVREMVQNARDAEVQYSAPMAISYLKKPDGVGTLRIVNEGTTIPREALLFGTTSKADRADMIGHFGEGMKIGILALLRVGGRVKIRTGAEVWTAMISRSEKFDADVLCFDCHGGNRDKNRVSVEVEGVSETLWTDLQERFLFVKKPKKADVIETPRGDLLLGDAHKGKVFVKGVYVQDDPRLQVGYNFKSIATNRDRGMISGWDMQWETAGIWSEAAARRPDIMERYFEMLLGGAQDLAGVEHSAGCTPKATRDAAQVAFTAKFGEQAVAVSSLAESAEIGHLGKKGVVVPKALATLLEQSTGSLDAVKKALANEVTHSYSWDELTKNEADNLLSELSLLGSVRSDISLDSVDVVDFRSPSLMGQYVRDGGRVRIAARLLRDREELLATLVHEFAHRVGGDGEKEHVMEIECTWRDIVRKIRGMS